MSTRADEPGEDPRRWAELSALADGTLDPARRQEVEQRLSDSPELRELLERERRAVAMLSAARRRDRAPAGLRTRIERDRRASRSARPMRIALAGAAAALALAIVLILPSGTPGGPSVSQAAALSTRGQTLPAPAPDPMDRARLSRGVGRLRFPNWASSLGWRATGARTDRLGGRRMVTVYYASGSKTVAYSIVSGAPLARPSGPGYEQAFHQAGRIVVTWRNAGHTCLLSGRGLPERILAWLVGHS